MAESSEEVAGKAGVGGACRTRDGEASTAAIRHEEKTQGLVPQSLLEWTTRGKDLVEGSGLKKWWWEAGANSTGGMGKAQCAVVHCF